MLSLSFYYSILIIPFLLGLGMDTAYLTVKNNLPEAPIHLLMQSEECYRCPMNDYGEILPSENHTFQIDTRWYNNYSIVRNLTDSSSLICQ